jgi:putative ABC transport system ATP-binding protein
VEAARAIGIRKSFGAGDTEVQALRGVDLTLETGKIVALLGPSGAGKSTLIKALGLVSLPQQGSILMRGKAVVADGRAQADLAELRRHYLGFVFQKPNLMPFLTARQNVEIAAEIGAAPEPKRRALELLDSLGLAHRTNAWPDTLSGGEQQRVAIARALANHPTLILADEPTAALDRERGRSVMELLRQVAREHSAAVLVVTHDQRALDVFDSMYHMEDGRIAGQPVADQVGGEAESIS